MIDNKILIGWGLRPGPHIPAARAAAQAALAKGRDPRAAALAFNPPPTLPLSPDGATPFGEFIEAESEDEVANLAAVRATMQSLARTPVVEATAVMPDACPAGGKGTIPVGGVAASRAIHPGMHSADICCSVAITVLGDIDPAAAMEAGHRATHFGPGGREDHQPDDALLARFDANPFLQDIVPAAKAHFATQGDGNHFLYVGRLRSSGEVCLVTHHGSRKPGALLYKKGLKAADAHRAKVSPETLKANAWLEADSREGEDYWNALQVIRAWTKANHWAIHDLTAAALGVVPRERFWNEHNFVFRRGDLFYHGKGATPAWANFADDAAGKVLIPLSMGAPILIAEGADRADALGFCPHGAGRNLSRSAHMRRFEGRPVADILAEETAGLDVRFYCGIPDVSELPSAYKRPAAIEAQIERFGLAEIVDHVDPYGSIMAGDWERDAPWRKRRAARAAAVRTP